MIVSQRVARRTDMRSCIHSTQNGTSLEKEPVNSIWKDEKLKSQCVSKEKHWNPVSPSHPLRVWLLITSLTSLSLFQLSIWQSEVQTLAQGIGIVKMSAAKSAWACFSFSPYPALHCTPKSVRGVLGTGLVWVWRRDVADSSANQSSPQTPDPWEHEFLPAVHVTTHCMHTTFPDRMSNVLLLLSYCRQQRTDSLWQDRSLSLLLFLHFIFLASLLPCFQ